MNANAFRRRAPRSLWIVGALAVLGCEQCLPRVEVESVQEHAYPTCDGEALPEGEVVASGHLRAGPALIEQSVSERWEIRRRGCVYVFTVRQEWERQNSDVEVVFDLDWKPIRAWKRMTIPGLAAEQGRPDVRLYELRNEPATLTMQNREGRQHRQFRGSPPVAVVGPGRALVTAWIKAAGPMEVGDIVRGPVLDFREQIERIDEVALRRDPDRFEESLGRNVRVYTIFGRESIFTDEEGYVLGDLAGLRTDASLETPAPPASTSYSEPDPVNTP